MDPSARPDTLRQGDDEPADPDDPVARQVPPAAPVPRLRLLGEPRLLRAGGADHRLERRDAALLAVLALDGPQPRATLARWLWPGVDPAGASNNLRQRLFRLRRAVEVPVVTGADTLRLADDVAHDLHPDRLGDAALDTALLGSHDYTDGGALGERIEALRSRWRQRCVEAIEARADRHEAARDHAAALGLAQRLLQEHPSSEHAHRRVMRLHYLRGDRAAGLAAFERCRRALSADLGAEPTDETLALARMIRHSGAPDAAAAEPTVERVGLARPPRLVGRQAEWATLQHAWRRGAVIVLRGAAGIGKSRLAEDFVRAHGGAVALKLHAGEQGLPYALLSSLLREVRPRVPDPPAWAGAELARLGPGWGAPATGPLQVLRLHQAVEAALAGWRHAGLGALLIDDLQWADAASLEALWRWLASTEAQPPQVLLSLRDDEAPAALDTWLAGLAPDRVADCRLGPLDAAAVQELVASLHGPTQPSAPPAQAALAARRLMRQVGGHPFMLLELLRAEAGGTPAPALPLPGGPIGDAAVPDPDVDGPLPGAIAREPLLRLLERRLSTLPAGALRLIRVAAVADGRLSVPLAAEVLGVHAVDLVDDWRLLTDGGLMQSDGELYDVVAEAAGRAVPPAIAQVLHAAIAGALQRQAARADRVARHWHAAGQPQAAARAYAQAAESAHGLSRRQEELSFWDQAAACHAQAGERAAAWRARHRAAAVALVVEDATLLAHRLERLVDAAADDDERLDALLAQCRAQLNDMAGDSAVATSRQAIAIARSLTDARREVAATGWHGLALAMSGDIAAGLATLEPMRDPALQVADPRVGMDFFGALGYVLHLSGRYHDALDAFERAASQAEQLGDLAEAHEQVGNLMVCHLSLGERAEALRRGEQALSLWRRLGEPASVSAGAQMVHVGTILYGMGRFAESLEWLNRAAAYFRVAGPAAWTTIAEHRLHTLYLRLGQHARARQALGPLPPDADAGRQVTRQMNLCRSRHAEGGRAGAGSAATLQAALDRHGAQLSRQDRFSLQLLLAAHLPCEESVALCRAVLDEALAARDRAAALHARARLAAALGRMGHPEQAACEAALAWEDVAAGMAGQDVDHVALCWLICQAAEAGGDSATARAALRSGADWIARALPHVPAPFVDSFRHRNPVNRDLLAAAARRLADG